MNIRILVVCVVAALAMAAASPAAFGATVSWNGNGDGSSWSDPANWSPSSVPTSNDDVIINFSLPGAAISNVDVNATVKSITVGPLETLEVNSGRVLTVTNSSTVNIGGVLHLAGGDFSGNGALIVNGEIDVNGATLGGSGALTISGSGIMAIGSTSSISVISRNITNAGTINFVNTSTEDTTFDGATLTNTGTIDFQNNYDLNSDPGSHIINNNSGGLIVKSSGSGTVEINLTVNNAAGATIEAQTGDIELNGGGTVSGTYSIASSQFIRLLAGTYTMSGSPTVSGGGLLRIDGATLHANTGVNVTIPNLTLASGTVTGAGDVRVSGNFDWRGGTIAGSGMRVLNSTSTPTLSCNLSDCLLDGAALQLRASATFAAGMKDLVFSNGASLIIDAGKTLGISLTGDFRNGSGAASSIINNGTIWKNTSSLSSTIDVPVTLSGTSTVDIDDGTLQFAGGVTLAAGADLDIAAGGTLEVTAGVFLFNSGTGSMPGIGAFEVSGGKLRVPTGVSKTIPNVTLQGSGVIDGGGNLFLSGTITWAGGTMGSAAAPGGATLINSGSTLNVTAAGAPTLTQSRFFENNGTLNLPASGGINLSGSATIQNNGTIAKNTSGLSTIQPRVENSNGGTVSATTGTIAFSGGGIFAGAYSISSGATIALAGGTFTLGSTSTVTGAGTLSINGATLDAGAGVDRTLPNLTLASGVITGAGAVRVSGTFNWLGGTIAGSGPRVLNSTSTPTILCNAGIDCVLDGAALQLQASMTYSPSTNAVVFTNGASMTIDAGKTLSFTNSGDFLSGAGGGSISNNGTISKITHAGTSNIGVPVNNNSGGTVSVNAGTLQFDGGVDVAAGATVAIAAGQTLEVTGGVFQFNGTGSVPSGNFKVSAGTLRIPTSITRTIANLTLQGSGVIDGGGDVHMSGNFAWLGGTIAAGGARVLDSTSAPTISCSTGNCLLNGATLLVQANSIYSASSNALVLSNGASLTLDAGQTINVTNDGDFVSGGGASSSIVIGGFAMGFNACIWKTTTSGTSIIGVPVTMSGSLKADAGTLQIAADVTAASGAIVHYSPGATIEVTGGVFLFNSSAISFPATGDFKVSAGTLRVPTGVTLTMPNVTLQGSGIIDGGGTLILSGTNTWTGGTIAGSGALFINSGGTMEIGSPSVLPAITRNITNSGTMTILNSSAAGITVNGATIDNFGTIDIQNGHDLDAGGGTPILNNHSGGVIRKSIGSGVAKINFPVNNAAGATIEAQTGHFYLNGGGTVSGVYSILSGSQLRLGPSASTFTMSGSPTVSGAGTLSIVGATLDAGAGVDVTIPNLTLAFGTITGPGAVRVSGNFIWSAGTISGSGPRVLNSTSTLTVDCSLANCLLDGAALQFQAWATYSASSNALVLSNGASLILDPGQVLFVTNDGDFLDGGGAASSIVIGGPLLGVNGCIVKMTTSGTSIIGVPVTLSGSFRTDSGTLQLAAGVTAASGAIVFYSPGTTIEVTGGVFLFNSSAISFPATGDFKVSAGTLRVPTGVTLTMPNVTLQGSGVIDGGGTLTLSGTATWASGSMGSAAAPGGITEINSGSTLNITAAGSQTLTQGRELQNSDSLNYSGSSTLTMSGGSKITNYGVFSLTADGNINVSGSATIDNNGLLEKNGGTGTSTLFPVVNSAGTVSATTGTLALAGGGTPYTNVIPTAPATIAFTAGTHNILGTIGGSGTIAFSGAAVTVSSAFTIASLNVTAGTATLDANGSADAFTMTGGTLAGSGTLTLNNGGTWSGGTMSGSGTTINPAAKSFSIPAAVTFNGRTLQNDGTLNVSGNLAGSGTIANNGALNGSANITIGPTVNNNGQVVTSTLLSLAGNGSHSGTFTASGAGSVIDFSGGTQTISGALAGTGKFRFSGAAVTVSGAWSGMAIDVTGGSVALNTNGTLPALTLSGGTLAGSGGLTVTGASTWSGGTMGGSGTLTFDTGATVAMPGTSSTTLARPLLNNGIINFAASSSAMLIDHVPVTNNGMVDIQSSQSILVTAGTPPFINNGTLKKSTVAGVMEFAAPLSNSGLVQIGAGTLHFSGTYTQSAGSTDVLPGATLQTTMLSLNGGTLAGNGTIDGTVNNHAIVAPGASPGTLTISGDYVQASNGALDIQLGGTAPGQYDRLVVSGGVTLGGALNVSTISGFVPAAGNVFQILTFGARPNFTTFAFFNGLDYGAGTALNPTYSMNDLQLITNNLQADLTASVTAPPLAASGSAFAYTVNIGNQGGSDATAAGFSVTLPPNVTFNGASPAICSGAANLICTIGALPNQSAAVVVLNVTANGTGAAPISVTAVGNEFDPNLLNNAASASTTITASAADLRIAVTGTPSTVAASRAIYTIVVTNIGPDLANNVAVSVTASPGLTFSANGGACTGSFPCTIGALNSGQSATINSAWDISPAAAGSVQLTVNAASSTADPDSSNNSASITTLIGACPAIIISAPSELRSGASAEATATLFEGAVYNWSISNGSIDSGDGTAIITFTAGDEGPATLAVNVTGSGCTLSAIVPITVKPRRTCEGTAAPSVPGEGTTTADAVVTFRWSDVEGASGYRLWLQQGDAPPRSLGRSLDASVTKIIPPGTHHWYVETLFDGCASHESAHVALTILPGQDCDTHGAPQLSAPANDAATTSASIAFSWGAAAKAIEYELWFASAGGVPTLIRTTSDTSFTTDVPPGRLEWYVRAIFGGCAATESAHRTFIYTPPPECTSQRPLLIAPAEGERLTSPVSFEWRAVSGATSYELYLDDVLAATTTSPHASGIKVPLDERRWRVRARLAQGCGALDSVESRLVVIAPPPSCTPLEPPVVTAPGQISSGVIARIQWTFVAGATAYVVQISSDPQFSRASTSVTTVTTRELPFTFTNESSVPAARYVRVYAIDTECVLPGTGPFSPVTVVSVLPPTGSNGAALMSDPTDVPYTLSIGAELAGRSFTAAPTEPWITVTPASGIVPPGGLTLHAFAHTANLPAGASTGRVVITTAAEVAGRVRTSDDTTTSTELTVDNISGTTQKPKSTPSPDALTIPAVANVTTFFVKYQSDFCITNTSAKPIEYQISFVPSGKSGIGGNTSKTTIEAGATLKINDIINTWFGAQTSSGTLEIHPVTETGLPDRNTFASSRTFAKSPTGGTFGQYVPSVPYANYVFKAKGAISLQQIVQSAKFRTNLGLVEGSGNPVSVQVRTFDAAGKKGGDFTVNLAGSQYTQMNLKDRGITLDDGRIEVEVLSGEGNVTAYASVLANDSNNDPLFVPPVNIGGAGHSKWVVPAVTELTGGSNNWHTDVRIFNSGKVPADLTLVFYSGNNGTATTRTLKLLAGEVKKLDGVLPSLFQIPQDAGGALHVSSDAPAPLVVTAHTYNETGKGTYGQFIPAVTPEETVFAGSHPLQILLVEESSKYHSNIGFAEVSGNAVTLEVSVFRQGHTEPVLLDGKIPEVTLAANGFLQIDSYLSTLGLADVYNARITVRVKEGNGRATAYLSLVDRITGDPTYVPAQQ
jgi:hypothetical protein